jgi:hypothetical protein
VDAERNGLAGDLLAGDTLNVDLVLQTIDAGDLALTVLVGTTDNLLGNRGQYLLFVAVGFSIPNSKKYRESISVCSGYRSIGFGDSYPHFVILSVQSLAVAAIKYHLD